MNTTPSEGTAHLDHGARVVSLGTGALVVFAIVYASIPLVVRPPDVAALINALLYVIPPSAAAYACWYTAKTVGGREGLVWYLVGSFLILMLAGEVYWNAWAVLVDPAGPPVPSPADVAFVASYAVLAFGVLRMTESFAATPLRRSRMWIDLTMLYVWVLILIYALVIAPLMRRGEFSGPGSMLQAFYLIADIALALYLVAFKRGRWMPWQVIVPIALMTLAVGDLVFVLEPRVFASAPPVTTLLDLSWDIGYGLLGISALHRLTQPEEPADRRDRHIDADGPRWPGNVAHALAAVGLPYFVYLASTWSGPRTGFWILVTSSSMLVLLLVTRSAIITAENRQMASVSLTDPLTGAFNNRYFHERVSIEIEHAARADRPVTVAVLDLDDFRRLNERFGHSAGDVVLVTTAEVIRRDLDTSETLCRVAGDRFGVIMPGADTVEAYRRCMGIRDRITAGASTTAADGSISPVTASVGIASFPLHAATPEELVRRADGALYWAKRHGKDQAAIFDPETVHSLDSREYISHLQRRTDSAMVESLAAAVDARDAYTQFHSRNVARLCRMLGEAVGLDDERIGLLESAALLHDVGKIGVPDHVLRKPDRLTAEELITIREHPVAALRILGPSTREEILPWIGAHHERWDGSGYPDGLKGEEIPLEARILALCDAFDAMTSDRPYRDAMKDLEAVVEINASAGTQFDPDLARVFCDLLLSRGA